MASTDRTSDVESGVAHLTVRNLGGIEACEVTFRPGVSVLSGRNATNRTSLLSAIGGVLGGTTASLKSDSTEGHVQLELDGAVYRREYARSGDGIQVTGSPYTDDEVLVDRFVALLEDNPLRRAVERNDPLRGEIMRPVDTDAIEDRIRELKGEKRAIETEIERVEARRAALPSLEDDRTAHQSAIEAIDDELATLREAVADAEAEVEDAEAAAAVIETLNRRRQELNRLEDRLEVKRAERDALRDDLAALESEIDELAEDPDVDPDVVEQELAAARDRQRDLDDTIASLTAIVEFNADLIDDGIDLAGDESEPDDVTAALVPDDEREMVCWTCGSQVKADAVRDRLDDLRRVVQEKRDARREVEGRIDDLESRRDELDRRRDRRTELERRLAETEAALEETSEAIEALEAEAAEVKAAIGDLEAEAAETEELRESDLVETYEQIAELEYERGQRVQQLEDVGAEIDEIEALPDPEALAARRDEVVAALEQEHARIDELEQAAVDAFNEHMDELLGILEYENVARVWLERKVGDGDRSSAGDDTTFDLHVVRTSSEGTGYEDALSTLSESEREVVGLVVALAGYLVHEVHEHVPFMLLDSLEAIDADRIAAVVSYFASYAPFLVVALLPEDAQALDGESERIPADVLAAE